MTRTQRGGHRRRPIEFRIRSSRWGQPRPVLPSATIDGQIYIQGVPITPLSLPVATGGDGRHHLHPAKTERVGHHRLVSRSPRPDPDIAARTITGTPTAVASAQTYSWNAGDADERQRRPRQAGLRITVRANTTPAFRGSHRIDDQAYSVGQTVAVTLPPTATSGNGPTVYTLTPALPDGLTFNDNPNVRTISGMPTTETASAEYTYSAGDSDSNTLPADAASLMFTVTVTGETVDATPAFANGARIPTQDFTVDVRIASLSLPQATGGDAPLTYTLTPALSAGLTFDGTARTITGTPTTAATLVTYRYTVTDMDGDTATLTFRVTVVASTGLTFGGATVSDQAYIVSQLITPLTLPVATRGDGAITYTLTPALPTGLTFNATARTITGTPTTAAGATDYTYTATDTANDTATLMFSIIVNTEQVQDMARNEIILPEATRALVNSTAVSITRRIGQAVGSIPAPTVGSFNLAGQQMGGQDNLANALRTHGEAMTTDSRDIKEMLADSNFVLPLNGGAGIDASTTAFWGSGEYRDFSGESGEFEWEGSLSGFQLGVDARLHNDLLVGVAVSLLESDIEYEDDGATRLLGNGDYELDMTSAHPYIGWRAVGADWWATVGLGSGDLKSTDQDTQRTGDLSLQTIGGGGSGLLAQNDNITLRFKGEIAQTQLKVDGGDFAGQEVDASSVRLALERSQFHPLDGGGVFEPVMEIAARYDSGDGENGGGAEVGGEVRYHNPATRVTAEGRIRALLGHSGGYEEWGMSGTVRVAPGIDQQGLSFSVSPGYGESGSGIQELWRKGLVDDDLTDSTDDYAMRLDARIGYGFGFALSGRDGVLTPYSEMTQGTTDSYRMGLNWKTGTRFDLTLLGERSEPATDPVEHAVLLKGEVRF